ncbi:Type VI secretion lipoprotein [Enhygromyxa salina]|uniref:Type VI secretion lipoprotein n=1 Tax=Enhygromyxa salina TaxID=215803 RepID=A0A2S9YES7_9BACT|nr:type VI secretion system lipoprotein TssJ [Enhygromyxa salina]PRQ03603.1 Type VI secretion lipoprotein [Enhygromyxa salina]
MPLVPETARTQPRSSLARVRRKGRLASALGLATSLTLTLSLGACKNNNKDTCTPDDYVYEEIALYVQASPDLNLDEEGNPLPTVVRIYQLSGDLATRSLDFTELWEDHEAALGDEYISDKEFQIYPDSDELIKITPEDGARYILAFGVFQQPVGNTWYRVYEVPNSYGQQACELQSEDKDPASLGEPCMYLYMERNQIDGGKNVPPGFDEDKVETACTPLYTPKTKTVEEDDDKKKGKDK